MSVNTHVIVPAGSDMSGHRKAVSSGASRGRQPPAHLLGQNDLIRKSSQVFRSHVQTACLRQVGQPPPWMLVSALIVVRKHGGTHISCDALRRLVREPLASG